MPRFHNGEFREKGREIDITLKGKLDRAIRTQDLEDILLYTPGGRPVRLSSIARVRPAAASAGRSASHSENPALRRGVTTSSSPAQGL